MSDRKEHDKFFQQALANPLIAKEFFEEYLPIEIKVLFLPSTLKLENDSFIEPSLKVKIQGLSRTKPINFLPKFH